jgi:outer membrane receptor for ferrienterochelin and colicins
MSVNRFFKTFELYGGAENLFDYTQHNPIIGVNDPTSIYFDATQIYAPMMGRRIYAGLRWWINRK